MAKNAFEKFINQAPKGAKKKEALRQEKRKIKQELKKKGEEERRLNAEKYRLVTNRDVRNKVQNSGEKDFGKKNIELNKSKKIEETKPSSFNEKRQTANAKPAPRYKQGKPVKQTYQQITQKQQTEKESSEEQMPLNKFIAHAGVCGRREAAQFVKEGKVQVNGAIVFEPGYKVSKNDAILFKGKALFLQKNLVYILVNKPKDYITTAKDPEGRKTILDLLKGATQERIYPVGRLDRNTTGVLLMTNDGELAQKLTHPSYEIKKIYEVRLDKPVAKKDMEAILAGITLEDGFINADAISYADSKDKSVVGIEIHSGRNRIVRRVFEHLGYDVKNLDRVMFANLTKKNVDRGKWRFLNDKEVRLLKYMNQSFVRAKKEK
ncbi:pseudouridine synthase [Panacibacter ginsenosidivorans]|uniref:Pseudouridine synthase n=1 Tax=Panacibacter ginsenosidivorans TaxID=1813871 RepID=A0A5B8V812_9BACT|nr:pseudouridine synthase [Panacibacter ginsenosidivorans]QEC67305.1 pseudouridine synthase [Panacibacter ginsenosidivorans]